MLSEGFNPGIWKPGWRFNGVSGLVAQSVEQRPFKPLVLGSSPSQPTTLMPWVYILSSDSGRYYIGSTVDLDERLSQQQRGHTHYQKTGWKTGGRCRSGDNIATRSS